MIPSVTPSTRPTINDVARRCGVSASTVSRAINGKHEKFRIPAQTCEQILLAAAELGYSASWSARALKVRETKQIGLLYRHAIPETRGVHEHMLQAVSETLNAAGYQMAYQPTHSGDWTRVLADRRFDGCMIIDALVTRENLDCLVDSGLPTVLMNSSQDARFSRVITDDAVGMALALDHLRGLGHRRIAYVRQGSASWAHHYSVELRRESFLRLAAEHGLAGRAFDEPIDPLLDREVFGPGGFTAVIAYSHTESMRLLSHLQRRGHRVPQDVSLIGFNDVYPLADLYPALSAVAIPGRAIGTECARLLLEQIRSGGGEPPTRVVLPQSLVARESTAPVSGPI